MLGEGVIPGTTKLTVTFPVSLKVVKPLSVPPAKFWLGVIVHPGPAQFTLDDPPVPSSVKEDTQPVASEVDMVLLLVAAPVAFVVRVKDAPPP
jgi:hypothetical protein